MRDFLISSPLEFSYQAMRRNIPLHNKNQTHCKMPQSGLYQFPRSCVARLFIIVHDALVLKATTFRC